MNQGSIRNARAALTVSTVIFALLALWQIYRALAHVSVAVQGVILPSWFSLVVALAAFVLALWMGLAVARLPDGSQL